MHGLPALRQMPGNPWLQVAMIRMNHKGASMRWALLTPTITTPIRVPEVVQHVHQVKKDGMGVMSMKPVGYGTFTQHTDRVGRHALCLQYRQG